MNAISLKRIIIYKLSHLLDLTTIETSVKVNNSLLKKYMFNGVNKTIQFTNVKFTNSYNTSQSIDTIKLNK